LLQLADEVREERAQLAEDRARLRTEKTQVAAILRQVAVIRAQGVAAATPLPQTRVDAAALLEVVPTASRAEVERAFRAQIVRCHPDRVADLHPNIRGQAEGLTVALNAAREIMLGTAARPRRRSA
jgi:DnaJ-domain-containing protein 1